MCKPIIQVAIFALLASALSACASVQPIPSHPEQSRLYGTSACLRETGSHIPPPQGQCLPVAGRSYNRAAIEATGAATVAGALQRLDPAITSGH